MNRAQSKDSPVWLFVIINGVYALAIIVAVWSCAVRAHGKDPQQTYGVRPSSGAAVNLNPALAVSGDGHTPKHQ